MRKNTHTKIKSIDKLTKYLQTHRKNRKKIVHCHGVFDLLHPGHIKYFESAKKKGDILVVTITKDEFVNKGPGRPIFNQELRAESIAAIECVDAVCISNWPTAVEMIKIVKPNLYVKGGDYTDKKSDLTGKIYEEEEAVKSVGGMLHFTDDITFSSSSLINTYFTPYPEEAKDFFSNFKNKYSTQRIIDYLKDLQDIKVLVIGDIIIDEYCYCVGVGKTPKDNIIATKYLHEETFAGGVLAASNHIAGFCKDISLTSLIGTENDYSDFIVNHLKTNIKTNFFYNKNVHTIVKRRFVDPNFLSKLFEICYLEDGKPLLKSLENEIYAYLNKHIKEFDMVLVTDFGHGLISPRIVKTLCSKANFLAVNVQTNSANMGFNLVTKFNRADFVCIDEPEVRLACHDRHSNIKKLISIISKKMNCDRIIITRGHKGALAYSKKEGFIEVPVFSKEVVDRIGAGDAFFSVTAPCIYKNTPMDVVGLIGNAVGAMKVLIVGNRSSVEPVPLFKYITTLMK